MGGPENGNFPLLYVVKMSLRRWVGGSEKPQNTLTQCKNGPLDNFFLQLIKTTFSLKIVAAKEPITMRFLHFMARTFQDYCSAKVGKQC